MASPSQYSIALAHSAAIGHFNAGLDLYKAFAIPRASPTSDAHVTFTRTVQVGVPAITNLALSLELLLKVHHFQTEGIYPRGHDISVLGSGFGGEHMATLRKNYSDLYSNPSVDKGLEFRISTSPQGSAWAPASTSTYDLAIAYIGNAYERWRYIYEEFRDEMNISFAFAPLYFASSAVNKAIVECEGNLKISTAVTPPNTSLERARKG
jgi:hypothetical protein